MKLQLSLSIQRNWKIFHFEVFLYFQKAEVYLEPIQTSKTEIFVKIVDSLMPLTVFKKSSILDIWLDSKNATKSFNKSFCEFNIFGFSRHLVKYFFFLLLCKCLFPVFKSDHQVLLFKTYFYSNEYLGKNIHKYANFS